ncbi:MAG: hypothetical protein ACRDE8_02015 [Ginsengibacter sp.]
MKSMKSKAFFLALSCFAISASFAQDTPKTPKPDTTKEPKHDSSMVKHNTVKPVKQDNTTYNATTLFMMNNENKLAAKKESTNDITI